MEDIRRREKGRGGNQSARLTMRDYGLWETNGEFRRERGGRMGEPGDGY